MVDTAFYVPDAKYDRLSEIYDFDPESGALSSDISRGIPPRDGRLRTGGGGLVSTLTITASSPKCWSMMAR